MGHFFLVRCLMDFTPDLRDPVLVLWVLFFDGDFLDVLKMKSDACPRFLVPINVRPFATLSAEPAPRQAGDVAPCWVGTLDPGPPFLLPFLFLPGMSHLTGTNASRRVRV